MKLKFKRSTLFSIFFIILVFSCLSFAILNYVEYQSKLTTFRHYEMSGHIRELILITTFPDEGLYIGFDNGEFRFIDINYWWTYTALKLVQPQNNVTLSYERNDLGNLRVTHIQEVIVE